MRKLNRSERLAVFIKILSDMPNKIFTFNYFTEVFKCAKSTLSEDVDILKDILKEFKLGTIDTIPGAAGGVKYSSMVSEEESKKFVKALCQKLSSEDRILSGGFIYMTDVIYNPQILDNIGKIIATKFMNTQLDHVVTIETKGIPIALLTAKYLNIPLAVVRRNSKVTEGSSVNINYIATSTRTIETMSISKRAIKKGARVLFVDDFMKGGGSARGIIELMGEFEATVEGIAVLISTNDDLRSFDKEPFSLLRLEAVNIEKGFIDIVPGI
jgi:purine operon repressor